MDPAALDKSVTSRIPTRTNTDDRYFTDKFQAMPLAGYTEMFSKMLDHPNITVEVGVEFDEVRRRTSYDELIFTGPVDEFFDYRYGKLPYRSLRFRHETLDQARFQRNQVTTDCTADMEWILPVGGAHEVASGQVSGRDGAE